MAPPGVGEVWGEQQLLSQIVFCTAGEEEGTPPSCTFLHGGMGAFLSQPPSHWFRREMKAYGAGGSGKSPCFEEINFWSKTQGDSLSKLPSSRDRHCSD